MGLRREPENGWALDDVFVGVGTLGVVRELFRQEVEGYSIPVRAWDIALWSGVTPQGVVNSLDRLRRLGLVVLVSAARGNRASRFRLDRTHPLFEPLSRLFLAERVFSRQNPTLGAGGPSKR